MSEKLPTVSAKAMTRILLRLGFVEKRQRGSHRIFARGKKRAVVPIHAGDLKPGTLRTIMESAGLTADDLRTLL